MDFNIGSIIMPLILIQLLPTLLQSLGGLGGQQQQGQVPFGGQQPYGQPSYGQQPYGSYRYQGPPLTPIQGRFGGTGAMFAQPGQFQGGPHGTFGPNPNRGVCGGALC